MSLECFRLLQGDFGYGQFDSLSTSNATFPYYQLGSMRCPTTPILLVNRTNEVDLFRFLTKNIENNGNDKSKTN